MPEDREVAQFHEVRKTMVFGLGTTGVTICRMLADRISEEYGSITRTPWVRFLCLETNRGQADTESQTMPIIPISIEQDEYQRHCKDPSTLNDLIEFQNWADISTLNAIENITAGAGNIRMAGRLAFLYPNNYYQVVGRLAEVVAQLRDLTVTQATEARGQLRGGANPQVSFTGEGEITYIVVGSLCGGTASGISTDFGYFLRHHMPSDSDEGSKLLAFFTLPRPDLTTAVYELAEHFKRNAFCAVKEMYHYFQVGRNKYTVKYPGRPRTESPRYPYDLVMLAWPTEGTHESEEALNRAVAERIFLNVFTNDADPFVNKINAPAAYRVEDVTCESVFCTFGLSLMEYPAARFVDACAHRLMHHAVERWNQSQAGEAQVLQLLEQVGITWERLKQDLLSAAGNPEIVLRKVCKEAVDETLRSPTTWHSRLGQIDLAFGDHTGATPHPELPFGLVPSGLSRAAKDAVERITDRLTEAVGSRLLDIDFGTASVLKLVEHARENLQQIAQMASVEKPSTQEMELYVGRLSSSRSNFWLRALFMSGRVAESCRRPLQHALDAYIERRTDEHVLSVLKNEVIPELTTSIDTLVKRLRNLRQRMALYREFLRQEAERLSIPPVINGVMPIEPNEADLCYRRCLKAPDDPVALERNEHQQAKEALSTWTELGQWVVALNSDTLFDSPPPVGDAARVGMSAVSRELHNRFLSTARNPFLSLMSEDVLRRWNRHPNRDGLLADMLNRLHPFIPVSSAEVSRLKGGPPVSLKVAVYPGQDRGLPHAREFWNQLSASQKVVGFVQREAPGPTRAMLVEDFYCIPIEALTGVTAHTGDVVALELAQEGPRETFSRKDVSGWEPVSDKERRRERECKVTLGMAVVVGLAQVRDSKLRVPYEPEHYGDADFRNLPPDFDSAVRQWAVRGRDMDGRSLAKLEGLLEAKIAEQWESSGPEEFLRLVRERLDRCGHGLSGWNREVAGRIIQRYCERNPVLLQYRRVVPPDSSILSALRYKQGQITVTGGAADRDGYYCIRPGCGAFLGASDEEFRVADWRCSTCGTDYHDAALDAKWLQDARTRKQGS